MTDTNVALSGSAVVVTAGANALGAWNDWSLPLLGVPLTVIMVAAFGAFVSNAYQTERLPPKKLYLFALTNTFLASVCVAVLPGMMGWEWVNDQVRAPLAGMIAFGAQWWVPAVLNAIPAFLRKIFRIDKNEVKNNNEQDK